jgi:hypothetical protein
MTRPVAIFLSIFLSTHLFAVEIGDVDVEEKLAIDGQSLVLNGAGIRTEWFFNLYVGSLYLLKPDNDADRIIKADEPMALRLQITSGMISSEKMTTATMEGFEKATDDNITPIKPEIDSLLETFKEEIKEGDVFTMVYIPKTGVKIYKKGKYQKTIAGIPFKQALFAIWIGDDPAQNSLKKKMLGKGS